MFTLTTVTLVRDQQMLLEGISCHFTQGQIHTLLGPSGAGKSSLLRLFNRLYDPTNGSITLFDTELTSLDVISLRRQVGMVLQRPIVFPGTVATNIAYPLHLRGDGNRQLVENSLAKVGLPSSYLLRDASHLSGGEQQLVGIARTLVNEPDVLLLDEPTSALDPTSTQRIEELVKHLNDTFGITVLWVTHSLEQARRVGSTTTLLVQGKLVEQTSTAQFFVQPQTETAELFIRGELGSELPAGGGKSD